MATKEISQPELPNGFHVMSNQVAGHTFTDQTPSLGMIMQDNSDCVLKPLGKPECGKRELNFYETLKSTKDSQLLKLQPLVPKFYNKVHLIVNQKQHTFIKLEDLTSNMQMPCVMDIKIGRRTYDPLATPQKQKVEEEKYLKCKQPLGLCLPGFQMYCRQDDNTLKLQRFGKEYGKNLDESGFRKTIAMFLNSNGKICRPLIEEVLRQLYEIRNWFVAQTFYHFYASSILIVYDAAVYLGENIAAQACDNNESSTAMLVNGHTNGTNCLNTNNSHLEKLQQTLQHNTQSTVRVRMIDFAHVFPAEGGTLDDNYLFGLRNLITILEDLLQY